MTSTVHRCSQASGWGGVLKALAGADAGDEVQLDPGEYRGNSTLVVPSGVAIRGMGDVILTNDGRGPTMSIEGNGVLVAGMQFLTSSHGQVLLKIHRAQDVDIVTCVFDGAGMADCAIAVVQSRAVKVTNCAVWRCSTDADHLHGDIQIWSSHAVLTGNVIQGGFCGISVASDEDTLHSPASVQIVGNRLHDCTHFGISILSCTGHVERNECWNIGHEGINVGNDPRVSRLPLEVVIFGNRCHDNGGAGISVLSTTAVVEANECWGSRSNSGIVIEPDVMTGGARGCGMLSGNRCHDNSQAGICYSSSSGRADSNECWANRIGGIVVQDHDLKKNGSPLGPSEVVLVGNRCHDNRVTGIAFLKSTGEAEANECWGNSVNTIHVDGDLKPNLGTHFTAPRCSLEELQRAHIGTKLLKDWLADKPTVGAREVALADFLASGACKHCFARFWTVEPAKPSAAAEVITIDARGARPTQIVAARQVGCYRVAVLTDRSTQIEAIPIDAMEPWSLRRPPSSGLPALTALLPRFGKLRQWALDRKRGKDGAHIDPPRWIVGLVSADDAGLDRWLADTPARREDFECDLQPSDKTHDIRCTVFDLGGLDSDVAVGESSFVQHHALSSKSFWQRVASALDALAFIPASQFVITLVAIGLIALAALQLLAVQFEQPLWSWPFSLENFVHSTLETWSLAVDAWDEEWKFLGGIATGCLLLCLLLINRLLPGPLGFSVDGLLELLDTLEVTGAKWLSKKLQSLYRSESWGSRILRSIGRSEACQRQWIRRHVYGYQLFRAIRRRQPPLTMVVVRNVDVPSQEQINELRKVLDVCPSNHAVLLVTQMRGLSMLVSAFLDVWFPTEGEDLELNAEAFVIHDPASVRISALQRKTPDSQFSPMQARWSNGWSGSLVKPAAGSVAPFTWASSWAGPTASRRVNASPNGLATQTKYWRRDFTRRSCCPFSYSAPRHFGTLTSRAPTDSTTEDCYPRYCPISWYSALIKQRPPGS
jgi:hypothetical protein